MSDFEEKSFENVSGGYALGSEKLDFPIGELSGLLKNEGLALAEGKQLPELYAALTSFMALNNKYKTPLEALRGFAASPLGRGFFGRVL